MHVDREQSFNPLDKNIHRTGHSTFDTAPLAILYSSVETSWIKVKHGFLNFSICFLATTSNAWSGVKSPSLIPEQGKILLLIILNGSCKWYEKPASVHLCSKLNLILILNSERVCDLSNWAAPLFILFPVLYLGCNFSGYAHQFLTHEVNKLYTWGLKFTDLLFCHHVKGSVRCKQANSHSYVEKKHAL